MRSVQGRLFETYKGAAERLMPVLKESGFAERGVSKRQSPHLRQARVLSSRLRSLVIVACPPLDRPPLSSFSLSLDLKNTHETHTKKQVLTPDEFVKAGDFLVRACPTWSWEAGDPGKARSYLPKNKQYLVTRGVPSRRRASAVEGYGSDNDDDGDGMNNNKKTTLEAGGMEGDDEGWVAPPPASSDDAEGGGSGGGADGAAEEDPAAAATTGAAAEQQKGEQGQEEEDEDDIPDLDDLEIVDGDDIDEAALPPAAVAAAAAARAAKKAASDHHRPQGSNNDNVVRVRTYDLSISYDKYYQVPRFWLAGFDEDRRPLGAGALLEDVAAEHARKTVTMEPHPHLPSPGSSSSPSSSSIKVASIHPCRHASVMKKLASMGAGNGGGGGGGGEGGRTAGGGGASSPTPAAEATLPPSSQQQLDPESYLVLFLKFISSVIPTIEYDFTMHAPVGGGSGR